GAAVRSDVLERPIAAVPVQPVARLFVGRREQVAALHEIEIEVAVIVYVDERGAATHDLRKIELVAMSRMMNEADARSSGDVFKPGRPRLWCIGGSRRGASARSRGRPAEHRNRARAS